MVWREKSYRFFFTRGGKAKMEKRIRRVLPTTREYDREKTIRPFRWNWKRSNVRSFSWRFQARKICELLAEIHSYTHSKNSTKEENAIWIYSRFVQTNQGNVRLQYLHTFGCVLRRFYLRDGLSPGRVEVWALPSAWKKHFSRELYNNYLMILCTHASHRLTILDRIGTKWESTKFRDFKGSPLLPRWSLYYYYVTLEWTLGNHTQR